jgi:four helix bundle protein
MLDAHLVAAEIRGTAYLSLKSQVIRAVMSIPANIVEGRAQRSDREFSRFLGYAVASASELEYHLIAARDTGAISYRKTDPLIERTIQVRKMLLGLQKRLAESKSA